MRILVIGGAGYIGSHMVKMLLAHGHTVVTLDNLVTGHRDAVLGGEFVLGDLANPNVLQRLFGAKAFDAVMHFASYIQVGESIRDPGKYYRNNVAATQNLLDAMVAHKVNKLIFSSTAAVYGIPQYTPIDEAHPKLPINPYGRSKWMIEQMLEDYDRAYGLRSICLRYFNAAGADPAGQLGERHVPETHLIPLVLQAAAGQRENIQVFGHDYDTPDGTCIRDYVHVQDLCKAHLLALNCLVAEGRTEAYNLGSGNGFSVQHVIDTAQRLTGREIPVAKAARRAGDPAVLVADSTLARRTLGWIPEFEDLESIVESAWQYHRKM